MPNLSTPHDLSRLQTDCPIDAPPGDDELESLRKENAEFKARLEEMEQSWLDGQREYENLLEEKSEVIRGLHQKIQELQEARPAPASASVEAEELLELQKHLEEDRRRLEDDEQALMVQMRQMEMAMSRERAELARQRTEMQRLQSEFNREMELASRDAGLRERLNALQRRQQAAMQGRQDEAGAARERRLDAPAAPNENTPLPAKANSGILRRLFG